MRTQDEIIFKLHQLYEDLEKAHQAERFMEAYTIQCYIKALRWVLGHEKQL